MVDCTDALIERAIAGDESAFIELCQLYRARLWRIVSSVARGPDAEDLVQDAVIRAWQSLHHYRREAPFEAWLCRIAVNAAHDHQKSAWKRRIWLLGFHPWPETAVSEDPSLEALEREQQRNVRQMVAALPEPQRTPIWLHYFEGFSIAEIGRLYSLPESTIRSRMNAALTKLKIRLSDIAEPTSRNLAIEAEAEPVKS
jgi:RNA polymerase sigma-70 factor (ECF subfamily)